MNYIKTMRKLIGHETLFTVGCGVIIERDDCILLQHRTDEDDWCIPGGVIGDMVLEGLLTACEMELADGVTDNDRIELFMRFVEGYQTERSLSDDEKVVFDDVYSISSAFWFTKIKYNENALEKLVERNETDQVGKLLEGIYFKLYKNRFDS